jgi:hypothetical protein
MWLQNNVRSMINGLYWKEHIENCADISSDNLYCIYPRTVLKPNIVSFKKESVFQEYIVENIKQIDSSFKVYSTYCNGVDIICKNGKDSEIIIEVKLRADRKAFAQLISYMYRSHNKYKIEPFGIVITLYTTYDLINVMNFYNDRTTSHKIQLYKLDMTNKMFERLI